MPPSVGALKVKPPVVTISPLPVVLLPPIRQVLFTKEPAESVCAVTKSIEPPAAEPYN